MQRRPARIQLPRQGVFDWKTSLELGLVLASSPVLGALSGLCISVPVPNAGWLPVLEQPYS